MATAYTSGVDVCERMAEGHGTASLRRQSVLHDSLRHDTLVAARQRLTLRATGSPATQWCACQTISVTYQIDGMWILFNEEWKVSGNLQHSQWGVTLFESTIRLARCSKTLKSRCLDDSDSKSPAHPDVDVTFDISDLYNTGLQDKTSTSAATTCRNPGPTASLNNGPPLRRITPVFGTGAVGPTERR